jgi:hypothetical protein
MKKLRLSTILVLFGRRSHHELAWNSKLPKGKNAVSLKILNPSSGQEINAGEVIVYSDHPVNGVKELEKAPKAFPSKSL